MRPSIIELVKQHKDVVAYLFFGVCTTIVNIVGYFICSHLFGLSTGVSTVVAWIVSVAFAYVTNKLWAFDSKSWEARVVWREAFSFLCCRLATGAFDIGFMMVTVDLLCLNDLWMKVISNVVVVVANYVASKLFIFKGKGFSD